MNQLYYNIIVLLKGGTVLCVALCGHVGGKLGSQHAWFLFEYYEWKHMFLESINIRIVFSSRMILSDAKV